MEFFRKTTHIDFMQRRVRLTAAVISVVLMVLSIVSLSTRGLALGIDFSGGTLIEVGYGQPVELTDVRRTLAEAGYGDATVQHFGTSQDVLIRVAPREGLSSADLSNRVFAALSRAQQTPPELRRVEFVGPQVGKELAEQGGLAMLYAMICILIYVSIRFEWRLAIGAILALAHDPIMILGLFSITGMEFDLSVLAATMAVIGYSVNDTIVVFDRIRENFRKMRKGTPIEIANASLNQTLSRTLMTSFTTMLVVVALFFFGGKIIHGFSLALIVGIVVGTYSSIYIASSAALALGTSRTDLMPAKKEAAQDGRP
jgi:preprotein translocase subunit SecF